MRRIAQSCFSLLVALAAVLSGLLVVPAQAEVPDVGAEAYIVIDAATGQVLVERNCHEARYPASITKILTIAMALEAIQENPAARQQEIEVSYRATHELMQGATTANLSEGEVVTLNDMLYTTQIASANDGANVLAEYMAGSIENFAAQMNAKAESLGLSDSCFKNPSGQSDPEHVVSAYDMAQITRWALTVPGFRDVFGAVEYEMGATNYRSNGFQCNNNNSVLNPGSVHYYPEATGSKQGYTDDARYTLVTTAAKGDKELICVALGCQTNATKYTTTQALFDYCFDSFRYVELPATGIPASSVPVFGGGNQRLGEVTVSAEVDEKFLLHNSLSAEDISVVADVPESYVLGTDFEPTVSYVLPEGCTVQAPIMLSEPMNWEGLDEILAANTTPWENLRQNHGTLFWLLICLPLALALLLLSRVLYVRNRRNKRRLARLAAARAQMSVRVAPRPPAQPERETGRGIPPANSARRPAYAPAAGGAARHNTAQRTAPPVSGRNTGRMAPANSRQMAAQKQVSPATGRTQSPARGSVPPQAGTQRRPAQNTGRTASAARREFQVVSFSEPAMTPRRVGRAR